MIRLILVLIIGIVIGERVSTYFYQFKIEELADRLLTLAQHLVEGK
jgi:hypothetical protein